MTALATDKFKKVAPNTGWQLDASGISDASVDNFGLVSPTGLPTGTGVKITIDRVDSSGALTPDKMERIDGVVSGTSIIGCSRGVEGTAQAHAGGAVVEILISADLWNDLMDGILVGHGQDGSHIQPSAEKTTPVDADTLGIFDSAASFVLKKLTWANLKEAIKIFPKTNTVTSDAAPTINTDTTDIFTITALATAITSMTTNLSGSPVNGQNLILRFLDNGTARTITWGASFVSRGATLPTTTVASKYLYVGLKYNSVASVWDCVAVSQEV